MPVLFKKFSPRRDYRKEIIIFLFTVVYILFFLLLSVVKTNFEFIFYSLTLLALLNFGVYIHRKVQLPEFIMIGLSLFGLMHVIGGNIHIGSTRLYELFFFGTLVRYDNMVHLLGSLLATLILNVIFFFFVQSEKRIVLSLYYFALFLMAMGVGVLNEIVELAAVILFHAQEAVGDYINNAVDLVFNAIGSLLAILMIEIYLQYRDREGHFFYRIIRFFSRNRQFPYEK